MDVADALNALLAGGNAAVMRTQEFEPQTDEEYATMHELFDELRRGHVGHHFTVELWGNKDHAQIRIGVRALGPQLFEEITLAARKRGMLIGLSAEPYVVNSMTMAQAFIIISSPVREQQRDELTDAPVGQVH